MKGLTHRERVKLILEHKKADRIPMDLGGSVTQLNDGIYFKLLEHLNLENNVAPYRKGRTANYYDERILEYLDTDFRHFWLHSPKGYTPRFDENGLELDEWGIPWHREENGFTTVARAVLAGANFDQVTSHKWPKPYAYTRDDGLAERAQYLREKTDYALVARHVISGGAFDYGCFLRGTEQWLMDLILNRDIVDYIVSRVIEVQKSLYDILLSATGPEIDIVEIAQDYGTQHGLLISPDLYRQIFKRSDAEVISFIKSKAPKAKVLLHSCGSIMDLLDDFIEIGVDIINPVQPFAAKMDHQALKKRFGDRVVFHGGIDIQKILPGDIDELRNFVKKTIKTLGKDGGYILGPANNIQIDTPPENIIAMYETAKEVIL